MNDSPAMPTDAPKPEDVAMTSASDLRRLADRCECGPISHEFEEAILVACGWQADNVALTTPDGHSVTRMEMPHPLASLDAAAGLIPAKFIWEVGTTYRDVAEAMVLNSSREIAEWGEAKTPAAALAAAALRARGAMLEDKP